MAIKLRLAYSPPTETNLFPALREFCVDLPTIPAREIDPERDLRLVTKFLKGEQPSLREWRKLIWLCHIELPSNKVPTLFHSQRLENLICHYELYCEDKIPSRYIFQGLVYSYFQVTKDELSNNLVRKNLKRTRGLIIRMWNLLQPDFLESELKDYLSIIFSGKAEDYLARRILKGDLGIFTWAVQQFSIPSQSWFWYEVFTRLCQEIGKINDDLFVKQLDFYISLLDKNESDLQNSIGPVLSLNSDEIWKALLERYAGSSLNSLKPHRKLKSMVLSTWGNPQNPPIQRQWKNYGFSDQAIQLVCSWCAYEDLLFFFNVLQSDSDTQRIKFWQQHIAKMSFTSVVLSERRRAYNSNIEMYKRDNKGRYATSWDAPASTDAFLMVIGDFVFIEFSQVSNACFYYGHTDSWSIRLNGKAIDVPKAPFNIYSKQFDFVRELKGRCIGLDSQAPNRLIHYYDQSDPFKWQKIANGLVRLALTKNDTGSNVGTH